MYKKKLSFFDDKIMLGMRKLSGDGAGRKKAKMWSEICGWNIA
jgi:hypothetical protein